MKAIVEGYLDINRDEVVSLLDTNRDDTEAITREIIREWAYKHSDQNQIKVSASYPKSPVAGHRGGSVNSNFAKYSTNHMK